MQNKPVLDPDFMPIGLFNRAFLKDAKKPVPFAVERSNGQMVAVHTYIHGIKEIAKTDAYYADRLVEHMLWIQGGFRVYPSGGPFPFLRKTWRPSGRKPPFTGCRDVSSSERGKWQLGRAIFCKQII